MTEHVEPHAAQYEVFANIRLARRVSVQARKVVERILPQL